VCTFVPYPTPTILAIGSCILTSDCDPVTYGLLSIWDVRPVPPHLAYWLRWGLPKFLLRLDLNLESLDLWLLSN
jgi:hypothetical protein